MIKYDKKWGKKSDIAVALVDFMENANLSPKEMRFVLREGLKVIQLRTRRKEKMTKGG